jgi:hypothetical protein
VNLYTVFVIEIETGLIKFKHENYQLWESPVMGFLNTQSHDFIILNKDGTSFLPLGLREKTSIDNDDGIKRMVHSLESCNYLKIENSNHLKFMNAKNGETDRIVMIQEQYIDYDGNTNFDDIYQICISEMNLRELMQF